MTSGYSWIFNIQCRLTLLHKQDRTSAEPSHSDPLSKYETKRCGGKYFKTSIKLKNRAKKGLQILRRQVFLFSYRTKYASCSIDIYAWIAPLSTPCVCGIHTSHHNSASFVIGNIECPSCRIWLTLAQRPEPCLRGEPFIRHDSRNLVVKQDHHRGLS